MNDWDRYCLEEYEALMADDQDNDELEDMFVLIFFTLNSFLNLNSFSKFIISVIIVDLPSKFYYGIKPTKSSECIYFYLFNIFNNFSINKVI